MKFTEFNLHEDLQRGIEAAGYVECMPVQAQVLQHAFGGSDLYVQSQTGTGKTAAYLIVIFQRLLSEPSIVGRKALIMVPTRELAVQVEEEAKKLGKFLPYKVGSFYGGVGYAHQQKMLKENVQVLVGTPGRVLDLNASGQMNLMDIAFLVLDEADRMFDMGFYPDLRKLIRVIPPADRRQTMLFSATLNAYIKNLAWEYTREPLEIEIEPEHIDVVEIEQLLYHVPSEDKMRLLLGIFEQEKPESAIIFCNTKRYTEIIAKRLKMNGIDCEFIMGDLPQIKRLKIIEDIKAGKNKFLIATDVAARGLDIEGLAMVVNYDLPNEAENYVHRIGRTGRAGASGRAISLASEQDVYQLPAIEKYLGKKIPSAVAEPTLYAEDKTAGLRIRTDDYTDVGRRSDRGRREDFRRDERDRRDDRSRRDEPRSASRGPRRDEPRSASGRGPRHDARSAPAERGTYDVRPGRGERTPARAAQGERSARPEGRASGRSATGMDRQKLAASQTSRADAGARQNAELSNFSLEQRMAYYREKYGQQGGAESARKQDAKSGPDRKSSKAPRPQRQPSQGRPSAPKQAPKQQPKAVAPKAAPNGDAKKGGLFGIVRKLFGGK